MVRNDLLELTLRHAGRSAATVTAVPGLHILRSDRSHTRVPAVLRPSLCFLVQGAKEVSLGSSVFHYRSTEFLFASVDLPVTGEVIEATPQKPYLCLALELDPSLVLELVSAGCKPVDTAASSRAIFVGKKDASMTDAFLRLMQCLERPMDAQVLAPGIIREIIYRLLMGPYGAAVRDIGVPGSQTHRIAKVIERLKRDFHRPLRVDKLAQIAGMSVSSFHEHFRKVTTLSPLQYQKRLRLQEARRLLLAEAAGAADVAFKVGYESASQFSREYARLFGLPPIQDVKRTVEYQPDAG